MVRGAQAQTSASPLRPRFIHTVQYIPFPMPHFSDRHCLSLILLIAALLCPLVQPMAQANPAQVELVGFEPQAERTPAPGMMFIEGVIVLPEGISEME